MTTLIWADGTLYTDSRVSFPSLSGGHTHMDDYLKIREPKCFVYKNEQVLAFTASGDARIFPFFDFFEEHCQKSGQVVDIETVELYDGLKEGKIVCNMIFVTDTQLVIVTVDEHQKLYMSAMPQEHRAATGTGYDKVGPKLTFNAALSGIDLMSLAVRRDPMSGGPINVWTKEGGIRLNVPMPTYWQVVKKLFKSDFKNIGARLGLCAPQTL